MRVKMMILMVGLALAIAPGIVAAQQWGFQPEDWELTMQGSGTSEDDGDNANFSVEGSLGYFFTKAVEVGLRQGIAYTDLEGSNDDWNASTRGFMDYHFDLMKLQPFVGVNFGYLYGDNVNETFLGGVEGGFKAFITDTAFLYGLIEWNFLFDDSDEVGDLFDDDRMVYALGLGIRF